jgi:hypothetical protein
MPTPAGKTGLADGHDVLVVAEDGQGVGGNGAGGDMQDAGQQFAGHLVHVRDHQQKPWEAVKVEVSAPAARAAVNRGGRAGFTLQLADQHGLAENVLAAVGCPLIADLADGGRRGNGINGGHFAHGIGHVGGCGIPVDGHHFLCHTFAPLSYSCHHAMRTMAAELRR